MKPKTPKCNHLGWVWIELRGFQSAVDQQLCLQLLKEGHAHPFKRFLLKVAYGKIWFRVRQRDSRNIAWLNGPAPNHCSRLLRWLKDSRRHDEAFRLSMGWPTGPGEPLGAEAAAAGSPKSSGTAGPTSRDRPIGTWA